MAYPATEGLRANRVDSLNPLSTEDILKAGIQHILQLALDSEMHCIFNVQGSAGYEKADYILNGYEKKQKTLAGIGKIILNIPRLLNGGSGADRLKRVWTDTWAERVLRLEKNLPVIYFRSVAENCPVPCLDVLFDGAVTNLSPEKRSGLRRSWKREYFRWQNGSLSGRKFKGLRLCSLNMGSRYDVLLVLGENENRNLVLVTAESGSDDRPDTWPLLLNRLIERGLRSPEYIITQAGPAIREGVSRMFPGVPKYFWSPDGNSGSLEKYLNNLHQDFSREAFFTRTSRVIPFRPKGAEGHPSSPDVPPGLPPRPAA